MGETSLTNRDIEVLRDILALTRPGRAGTTATDTAFTVFELLEHLLRSDFVSFQDMYVGPQASFRRFYAQETEAGKRLIFGAQELAELDRASRPGILEEYWWQLPCSLVDRTGVAQATSIRTWLGEREWAAHPVRIEYLPFVDEILLAYPTGEGRSLRILSAREEGRPYGLRELTLMELLLPHLRPLLEAVRAEHVQTPAATGLAALTWRQREILHLVALGMPNKQVARQLGISEGTVRKHLENAYERLGVQSRTEAIFLLRAQEQDETG